MNDFRLEHQQNAAAKILIRAPQLNLYASKNQLPPAIARFRLLQVRRGRRARLTAIVMCVDTRKRFRGAQVLSQSPEEADPAPQPAGAIPPVPLNPAAPAAPAVAADAERGAAHHPQARQHPEQHHQRDEQQQAQDANNEPPAADADIDSESEGFESERDDAGDSDDDSLSDLEADEEFIAPLIENEEEGGEGLEQFLPEVVVAAQQGQQQQQPQPQQQQVEAEAGAGGAAQGQVAAGAAAAAGQAQAAAGPGGGQGLGGPGLVGEGGEGDGEGDEEVLPDAA